MSLGLRGGSSGVSNGIQTDGARVSTPVRSVDAGNSAECLRMHSRSMKPRSGMAVAVHGPGDHRMTPDLTRMRHALLLFSVTVLGAACGTPEPEEDLGWAAHALGSAFESQTVTHVGQANALDPVSSMRHT